MRLALMGLVICALGMIGCGPDLQAICEAEVACEGGNDLDIEACVATSEIEADYLDDIGCGDEYDDYIACVEPYLKCQEEPTGQMCSTDADCGVGRCTGGECILKSYGPDLKDDNSCKIEESAFEHCS